MFFTSFLFRDQAYLTILNQWELLRQTQSQSHNEALVNSTTILSTSSSADSNKTSSSSHTESDVSDSDSDNDDTDVTDNDNDNNSVQLEEISDINTSQQSPEIVINNIYKSLSSPPIRKVFTIVLRMFYNSV